MHSFERFESNYSFLCSQIIKFFVSIRRNIDIQFLSHDSSLLVFKPVDELPQNSEGRWDDARCSATVHTLIQNINSDGQDGETPQRSGNPKPIIVDRSRIEAEDKFWGSNTLLQKQDMLFNVSA